MYNVYTVKKGDTIEKISQNFNVPIFDLISINNLQGAYRLIQGQNLKIPVLGNKVFDYYTVKKGDSVYGIAKKFNIEPQNLLLLNRIGVNDYIYPNQQIIVPKEDVDIYFTKRGDSLQKLMGENEITANELLSYNNQIYLLPNQLLIFKRRN